MKKLHKLKKMCVNVSYCTSVTTIYKELQNVETESLPEQNATTVVECNKANCRQSTFTEKLLFEHS